MRGGLPTCASSRLPHRLQDARIDEHPAGKSSLRDFKDVYCWTGDEKGRRSNASPRGSSAASLPRKRPPKARTQCG